jgi:hypothetical protein
MIHSVGHLCALLQCSPAAIIEAARAANVRDVLQIDGTKFFSADDFDRLAAKLTEARH